MTGLVDHHEKYGLSDLQCGFRSSLSAADLIILILVFLTCLMLLEPFTGFWYAGPLNKRKFQQFLVRVFLHFQEILYFYASEFWIGSFRKSVLLMLGFSKAPCCGAVVQWLSLLHNFIQLSLSSGYAQVQTLLAACRRFAMVRISDSGPGLK